MLSSESENISTTHAWICKNKGEPMEWCEIPLKKFEDDDIEIAVTHCAICGSDVLGLYDGLGPDPFPCVVGHEISGVVLKVGKSVVNKKVGDRVAVGPMCDSCLDCKECNSGRENYCQKGAVGTYGWLQHNGDKAYGGYSEKWRGKGRFAYKIPDGVSNEEAASFMCSGATTYAAIKNHGITKGSKIGVIGIGGLGHFAIQWAKLAGAEVIAISSSESKSEDAILMGADHYFTSSDAKGLSEHSGTLSHIICTTYYDNFDWTTYITLLDVDSKFIFLALPPGTVNNIPLILLNFKHISLIASMIASPTEIREVLDHAAKDNKTVKSWIQKFPMKQASDIVMRIKDGKIHPKYKIMLEN